MAGRSADEEARQLHARPRPDRSRDRPAHRLADDARVTAGETEGIEMAETIHADEPGPAEGAGHGHSEHESTGVDNRKLGMWIFLASEFLFFGALITGYLLYSNRPGFNIYPAEIYDIPFTSVSS